MKDSGEEDLEISIVELESKIKSLKKDIDAFVIAEDYTEVKKEADQISTSPFCSTSPPLLQPANEEHNKITEANINELLFLFIVVTPIN